MADTPDDPLLLLLLFDRIAVTTTGFSFSISPLARRESVRCASVYSYKYEKKPKKLKSCLKIRIVNIS